MSMCVVLCGIVLPLILLLLLLPGFLLGLRCCVVLLLLLPPLGLLLGPLPLILLSLLLWLPGPLLGLLLLLMLLLWCWPWRGATELGCRSLSARMLPAKTVASRPRWTVFPAEAEADPTSVQVISLGPRHLAVFGHCMSDVG